MVELATIYDDIDHQKVRLILYNIGFSPAAVVEHQGRYGLFLDVEQCGGLRKMKEVLAHELGHCATGCTHRLSSQWDIIEKHEYKANRWAFETYFPPQEIAAAIQAGYTENWQLAEWFDMPEEFIQKAVDYYKNARNLQFHMQSEGADAM